MTPAARFVMSQYPCPHSGAAARLVFLAFVTPKGCRGACRVYVLCIFCSTLYRIVQGLKEEASAQMVAKPTVVKQERARVSAFCLTPGRGVSVTTSRFEGGTVPAKSAAG